MQSFDRTLSNSKQRCRWHSFDRTVELEQAAVHAILDAAERSISRKGAFHIVLAGGTTPRRIYEFLRLADTRWASWHIYFGDERCLPPEHVDRNSHMAQLAWLDHVSIPYSQIHPIDSELGAELAVSRYTQTVKEIEQFDLVLLGLGEDGHTASLFPAQEWGDKPGAPAVIAVHNAPKPPSERVSLSADRLCKTDLLVFLVTGESKRKAVKDWRNGINIPAAIITPACGVDIYIENALL